MCVEIDLDLPLQKGTWVKYDDYAVFVIVLYEKLPVFCYSCGRIGHGESKCSFIRSRRSESSHQLPTVSSEWEMEVDELHQSSGVANERLMDPFLVDDPDPKINPGADDGSSDFGAWLKPRCQSGRIRGRGRDGTRYPSSTRRNRDDG